MALRAALARFSAAKKRGTRAGGGRCEDGFRQETVASNLQRLTAAIKRQKQKGAWPKALALLSAAARKGEERDLVAFTAAADVCARGSAWKAALAVLKELRSEGLAPDLVLWCALGSACSAAAQWRRALHLSLQAVREECLAPNAFSFGSAMSACSRASQWDKVLSLLEEAQSLGLANSFTFSSAITALANSADSESGWGRALCLWEEAQNAEMGNVVTFNATLTALERASQWHRACELLDSGGIRPDEVSYSSVATACARWHLWERSLALLSSCLVRPTLGGQSCLVRAMGHARAWEQALHHWNSNGLRGSEVSASTAWALEVAGLTPELRTFASSSGRKELTLLDFVQRRAPRGQLHAVLNEVRHFARKEWLKLAAGAKASVLRAVLRPGDAVLELGCFVGFSALLAAQRLRQLGGGGKVVSCELNPVSAMVARALIAWAGADDEVEVRVGLASDWIASGQLGRPDVVILDHRGSRYHEDLNALEPHLGKGARVLADNVLSPGAPLFLSFVDGRYDVTVHEVPEFRRKGRLDWMLLCAPLHRHARQSAAPAPPEFRELSAEVDRLCWRSSSAKVYGGDWQELQEQLEPVLRRFADARGWTSARQNR
ncbi:unnamed protein product [Effrenium voratum]|nr:unnamed protein product [Effrenium voratum]